MKRLLVLKCANLEAGNKVATEIKNKYEKLWGENTCEVIVLATDTVGDFPSLELVPVGC